MSAYINSFLIEPVVRQARRFSQTPDDQQPLPPQQHIYEPSHLSHAQTLEHATSALADGGTWHDTFDSSSVSRDEVTGIAQSSQPFDTTTADALYHEPTSITLEDVPPGQDTFQRNEAIGSNRIFAPTPVRSPSPIEDAQDIDRRESAPVDSLRAMSLDHAPSMSSNPSLRRVISHDGSTSLTNGVRTSRLDASSEPRTREGSPHGTMSGQLPARDGMETLREKLQQIHGMALSSEEKAARMHALMTADYRAFKASQIRRTSSDYAANHVARDAFRSSTTSTGDPLERTASETIKSPRDRQHELFNVGPKDLQPSYKPPLPSTAKKGRNAQVSQLEPIESEPVLGCMHYKRNVKIQCPDCQKWFPCRHCHDEAEDHQLVRKNIKNMLCMICGTPQGAAEYCVDCEEQAAVYYCDICKLWDNDSRNKIYHCPDCGICRKGEGLGKDYVHCKKCNVCISIKWATAHRCVERATECDCPICGEYMFTSSQSVVAMKCGHYIHRACYDSFMQTAYKCPICSRSAVNMETQWRKLDRAIEAQPMPEQWQNARASVLCNDCSGKSWTDYHWLGLKCGTCDSYNTQLIKVINQPNETGYADTNEVSTVPMADASISSQQPVDPPGLRADLLNARDHTVPLNRAQSPMSDVIAASADIELALEAPRTHAQESAIGHNREHETVTQGVAVPRSPTNTSITAVGSPPYPSRLSNSPEVQMTDAEDNWHEETIDEDENETSFWGESISPSGFLSRMSSPVNWGSPRFLGGNPSPRRREPDDDDDIDDAEIIEDDGEGVFGWGLSPSAWAISPPAFFTYRFRGGGSHAEEEEAQGTHQDSDAEEGSGGEEDSNDSESIGTGVEGEDDVGMDELELPGHR